MHYTIKAMKKLIYTVSLTALLFTGNVNASNYFKDFSVEQIKKLSLSQDNTLKFQFDYAGKTFISKSDKKALKDNEILQIDLVFTQFKRSDQFNQEALNQKRIESLKKELPFLKSKDIKWSLVEQTGASNFNDAKSYFHGFVVHFGKSLQYKELSKAFGGIQKEFTSYTVSNNGGSFKYVSGSKITIQPNSVTYADGTPVEGNYELKYREFRNPAEIAFSGIPMTFDGQNFNSVGMYELRGEKDGKELKLSKPAKVDFECTKGDTGVGFYQLNETTNKWEKEKDINPETLKVANRKIAKNVNHFTVREAGFTRIESGKQSITTKPKDSLFLVQFKNFSWDCYNKALEKDPTIKEVKRNEKAKTVILDSLNIAKTNDKIFGIKIPIPVNFQGADFAVNNFEIPDDGNRTNATLLAEGADKGHTYPTLVKGLNSESFGVYNCDQVYRVKNRKSFRPNYVNENGKKINQKHVLCVIDLKYNGSFSFNPNSFTADGDGQNVLILFTENKKVFVFSKEQYEKLDKDDAQPTFVMKDMTQQLSSPKALKAYLGV